MASYLNQLMNCIAEKTGLPHAYGADKVSNKDRPVNSIVWVRSISSSETASGFSAPFPEINPDGKTPICSKDMIVDIHIRGIDEDMCDAMLDAEIQALDESSIGNKMKLQSIKPNMKNDDLTSIWFYQVLRLTIPQNIYKEADIKVKLGGFTLGNDVGGNNPQDNDDGWISNE